MMVVDTAACSVDVTAVLKVIQRADLKGID
jgi:hypothetical protein